MHSPAPTAATLLAELSRLDPGDQVRHIVRTARTSDRTTIPRLLADLAARDAHACRVAVVVADVAGVPEHLVAATRSPRASVRAAALAARTLPDAALADVVVDGSSTDRRRATARLRRGPHQELADRLLPAVREGFGDTEAARLLPACSPATVAAHLAGLGYAVTSWSPLVTRHPNAVVRYAEDGLRECTVEARAQWWARETTLVAALAEHQPAATLRLAEDLLVGPLPVTVLIRLHRLLAVDAARVAALLLADPDRVRNVRRWVDRRAVRTRLAQLTDADLGALLRASGPDHHLLVTMLRTLPPSSRAAVFDLAHAGRDRSTDVLPDDVLVLLPHARRHAEAARMLTMPAVTGHRSSTLRISAWLPFVQARPVLDDATRSADADERGFAYELLVGAAAATDDPAVVTDVLSGLTRVPNEQDPVRSRVLAAVARVRPDLIDATALPALDALVVGAMDARDTSVASRGAVHQIAFGLLARPWPTRSAVAQWALDTVDLLGAWHRGALLGPGVALLRRDQEHTVLDRLLPRLDALARRGDTFPVIGVARALGRRAERHPRLQELLGRIALADADERIADAVTLWLAAPATRLERAEALVARDESRVTLRPVTDVLARRRPARLLQFAGRVLRGRFGTDGGWWLPGLTSTHLRSWLPEQVERYAGLLRRALADTGSTRRSRAAEAAVLARIAPNDVEALLTSTDVVLTEAAMTGLGRTDAPDAVVARLRTEFDGDRARVALYAAGRALRDVPRAALAPLLTDPGLRKVTALKELARWQTVHRPPGAVENLLAMWDRPDAHRDVRIAVLGALHERLDDERVWRVLTEAGGGDRHTAGAAVLPPALIAPAYRARYAAHVRALARHRDPEVARRALGDLGGWLPYDPEVVVELRAALTDLDDSAVWRTAAAVAMQPTVWTAAPELLPDVITTLVAAPVGPDAEPLRDRPAHQRTMTLVTALRQQPEVVRRHPAPVRAIADVLGGDPSTLAAAAQLRAVLVRPGPALVDDLAALADLTAGRPLVVQAAITGLTVSSRARSATWRPADVAAAVDGLTARGDISGGLLAAALIADAGPRSGWDATWRARLRALRAHPDPDVCQVALTVTTAPE